MTVLASWLLFALGISILLHFINVVLWRDDIACRDWYEDEWHWEIEQHDITVQELNDTEEQLAFALEQLYAKATLQEAMEHGTLVVVSDVDLQALAADKGDASASFSFDQLVTSALQDDDDDEDAGLVPND